MSLSGIVSINISRQTTAVSQQGFGTLGIFGNSASNDNGGGADSAFPVASAGSAKYRLYEDITAVGVDFATTTDEYCEAQAAFSSDNPPEQVMIARVNTAGPETYVEAIDAVNEIFNDFYGVVIIDRTISIQDAVSAHVEAIQPRKIFGTSSNGNGTAAPIIDQDAVTDTTSIGALAFNANRDRTFVIHHDMGDITGATRPDDPCIDGGIFGVQLPKDPGSSTWAFKSTSAPVVTLTTTQRNNAHSKNVNTYERRGGVPVLLNGTMASGEYIDVIRGLDWFEARLCERIFAKLVQLEKIPFTDAGIAIIEQEVRAMLDEAIGVGLFANDPAPVVTVPLARNVSAADKANRCLPDVKFTATLAGAIHKVVVQGVVTL